MSEVTIPASLAETASKIKDKTLKANAEALITRMGEVIEGIGDNPIRWRPSMLKVVQSMSNLDNLPEGAVPGKLIQEQNILENLNVIPLRAWTSRTMWPEDLANDQKICESPDAKTGWRFGACNKCEFANWDEDEKKVPCTKSLQFLCVNSDLTNLSVANFQKSQYRGGMDFQKLIKGTKTHMYKRMYTLEPAKDKNVFKLEAHFVPRSEYEITPDVEAFIVELFAYAGESRNAQLEAHEESMKRREEGSSNRLEDKSVHTDAEAGTIEVLTSESNSKDAVDEDSAQYEV